jgi:glycosyltransferase involved in cell wall biosynthesis
VDLVVGVTQALADEAIARGVAAERARGIIAGCDTETFRPNETARARVRQELGLNEDDVLLLHMGWTWHRKGGDLLADAMAQVGESVEGRRIVAASIGVPAEVDMGAVRRLEMTDRVWEYHQASDIFISASRSEGFGNGLIEAMACGRVAVAASAEGQQETFGAAPGVQAVPVGDSSAIARAITQLMTQRDEWGILGAANREHVIQHHSMRRWARDMADAYAVLQPGAMLSIPTAGCEEALGA